MNRDESHAKTNAHLPRTATAPKSPRHVLLAEDDSELRVLLAGAFLSEGYKVTECHHGTDLLDRLDNLVTYREYVRPAKRERYDLIVSAIQMRGATTLETIEEIQQLERLPPIILITAFGDRDTRTRAGELGVAAVFDKPFEFDDLMAKARELVSPEQRTEE